ncbi:MAG: guanylyltransferase [Synergistaceae bacterium]|jgi:tRNA(His) 5'-end guanylyltransferase|nr:guanylyltransferase [Synergistaceae bacterium]
MKFDDLDRKMRVYETLQDRIVPPEIYIVARIDGRNFTRLTKEVHKFEAPFDARFRDMMTETTKHLMDCGFKVLYGFTESDEISLLFDKSEIAFKRKTRKFNSILAGEASAKFSLLLDDLACFDCRISELPNEELVIDYFRWRNEDAFRNALNAHCYWLQRHQGKNASEAAEFLLKKSVVAKNEFLFQNSINFNDLPNWQKRGVGLHWESFEGKGLNKKTQEETTFTRRHIVVDLELPMKDDYSEFIRRFLE